jgi:hypothetical protein
VGPSEVGSKADQAPSNDALRELYHRLNNQLGIVLANAELIEAKAADASDKSRAAQLVASTLAAMGTVRELRQRTAPTGE